MVVMTDALIDLVLSRKVEPREAHIKATEAAPAPAAR